MSKHQDLNHGASSPLHNIHHLNPYNPRKLILQSGVKVEMDEFFDGRTDYLGGGKLKKGFSGRPKLAAEFTHYFHIRPSRRYDSTIELLLVNLRSIWVALDTAEALFPVYGRIDSVDDLKIEHTATFMQTIPRYMQGIVASLLNNVRHSHHLPSIPFPVTPPPPGRTKRPPNSAQVNVLYHTIKQDVVRIHERWEEGVKMASSGTNWLENDWHWKPGIVLENEDKKWSPQNRVATYVALTKKLGHPPEWSEFMDEFGKVKNFSHSETTAYIYPSHLDAHIHFWLFVLQTGWNLQTTLDIDLSDKNWAVQHPTSVLKKPKKLKAGETAEEQTVVFHLIIMNADKKRSGYEQFALSITHTPTAPYPLLMRYVQQTDSLRLMVKAQRQEAENAQKDDPHNPNIKKFIEKLKKDEVCPWLYVSEGKIKRLEVSGGNNRTYWLPYIKALNKRLERNYDIAVENANNKRDRHIVHLGAGDDFANIEPLLKAYEESRVAANNETISNHERSAARERLLKIRMKLTPFLKKGNELSIIRIKSLNEALELAKDKGDKETEISISRELSSLLEPKFKPLVKVSEKFRLSFMRDCFLNQTYINSGFNILLTKAAAGHKNVDTTMGYLRNWYRRKQNHKTMQTFQEHMWAEIKIHRLVDPVVLAQLMRNGEITLEQRKRLEQGKDRTQMGMGCKDIKHPPSDIIPDHISGTNCPDHICILCSHGMMFPDSYHYLARRQAELEFIQGKIPVDAWLGSDFVVEFEVLVINLEQFDASSVEKSLIYWRQQIKDKKHIVLDLGGDYH